MCGTDCFLMLLSVLFPPIGVWVKRGVCTADSLINLALCCLGFLPGLLHAWYIILQNPDPAYPYEGVQDSERAGDGTVTYYYVSRPAPQHPAGGRGGQVGGAQNYGTLGGSQPSQGQFPGLQTGGIPGAKVVYAQQGGGSAVNGGGGAGEGSAAGASEPNGPPPTYADVIKGDHKVQTP